jgi:hypothetical protein
MTWGRCPFRNHYLTAIKFTNLSVFFQLLAAQKAMHLRLSKGKVRFGEPDFFCYILKRNSMIKKTISIATLAIFMTLVSCQDEVPTEPIKSGSVLDFPNSIGNSWTYYVVDNLQPIDPNKPELIVDTVLLSITRYVSNDPVFGAVTVWDRTVNNQLTSFGKLAAFKQDTVYFYWGWEYTNRIGLIFPFEIRDSWQTGGFLSGDKTTVVDTMTLRLPSGTFTNVFVLENEMRTTTADKRIITLWFVPDFGFVKLHVHEEHAQAIGDTTWTLVSHNNQNF